MARGNGLLYLGVGAALMYMMDPQAGRKRRADLRSQLEAAGRKIQHGRQIVVRDASNRAIGAMAEARRWVEGQKRKRESRAGVVEAPAAPRNCHCRRPLHQSPLACRPCPDGMCSCRRTSPAA